MIQVLKVQKIEEQRVNLKLLLSLVNQRSLVGVEILIRELLQELKEIVKTNMMTILHMPDQLKP